MSFGAPGWLCALALLPALVLLYVRAERRSTARLQQFVAAKLLPELAATVNRRRRNLRFAALMAALGFAISALAQPRWGYTYEEAKRKGLDLILAVDTSRSMLSNDVQPNRIERVKLAAQDFINELQGDRVGVIAFAGRAFLQAPLTIDYSAVVDAINDLDTNTIPEGGTNISEAINLAVSTFGKSAIGNRALIVFTDGEELSGDATKTAKAAADAGVRVFTVGVGTPEGSLIPVQSAAGGTAFVKDSKGQVVKSKLDEKRLREVAEATTGIYLHLENGPATMKKLAAEGLSKMQAGDIDARLSRRAIERYQWPLAAACVALASWFLISERKRVRARGLGKKSAQIAIPAAAMVLLVSSASAAAPGIDAYRSGQFPDALQQFEKTLKEHPKADAADKLQFDTGAAAYKTKDYNKALDSFSQALLSRDTTLQSRSHYNLGNTLYERGEAQRVDDKKLSDWTNALQHYDQTLKLDPQNKEAKENYDYVKRRIEELKRQKEQQPTPTPSPSPQNKNQKQQKDDKQQQQQKDQQKSDKQQQKDQKDQKDQQQSKDGQQQDQQQKNEKQDQSKGGDQGKDSKGDQQKQQTGGQSPSPSPSASQSPQEQQQNGGGASPSPSASASPSAGEQPQSGNEQASPTPSEQNGNGASPSPSPGDAEGSGGENGEASPTAAPSVSPGKKLSGDVKGAAEDKQKQQEEQAPEIAEAEAQKEGKMSEKQAELLLRSMKDEEQRVQLDERKRARHVYNDW